MLKKIQKVSIFFTVLFLPILASAQLGQTSKILTKAKEIITTTLIPMAFTLALLFFFWGIAKYIWSAGGSDKEEGKKIMYWGVIALFVMSSVWGLVYFIDSELGLDSDGVEVHVPTIK